MKTIIAGCRNYDLTEEDFCILDDHHITEVVCGGATGVDEGGYRWAEEREIPIRMIRNGEMAKYGEVLIAFWDGKSRGTKNMIILAVEEGLRVTIYPISR